ncbi:MAG: heme ABC exporter ATP-binding protein CcmA [Acidimicrobiia bacterium]|nr:heme ABC exporter ATP-binding protein CcmA [Acidimicrobiia bacterium]
MPLVVRLRAAVCLLGRFPALAGTDLDVHEREVLLLSGPNGAGKTTLLRLLAGLVRLRSGKAEVLGVDLARDRRSHRRRLGFMGHDTLCYDDLTVRENLRFATRSAGATAATADDVLTRVGLEEQADVAHQRLSAGQCRRLSLAVALSRSPDLLLLDEPHAGLDPAGRSMLDSVISEAPSAGTTVIVASHETERVRSLADREVRIVGGRAERAVLERPSVDSAPSAEGGP